MLSKEALSCIFWFCGITWPWMEPWSPGPIANSLTIMLTCWWTFHTISSISSTLTLAKAMRRPNQNIADNNESKPKNEILKTTFSWHTTHLFHWVFHWSKHLKFFFSHVIKLCHHVYCLDEFSVHDRIEKKIHRARSSKYRGYIPFTILFFPKTFLSKTKEICSDLSWNLQLTTKSLSCAHI